MAHFDLNFIDLNDPTPYLRGSFRDEFKEYFYFTKATEWQSEHETRFLLFSEKKEMEFCRIKDSIASIYTGLDFPHWHRKKLTKIAGETQVFDLRVFSGQISIDLKALPQFAATV